MKPPRGRRQTLSRIHTDDIRRLVVGAGPQDHLTRVKQLAGLQVATPIGEAVGQEGVVAAPRQVHPPHLAVPLAESGRAGEDEWGVLVRRSTGAVFGQPGPAAPLPPHRVELADPPAVEGEQLRGMRWKGQGGVQPAELIRGVAEVHHPGANPQHIPEGQGAHQSQLRHGVD